MVVDWIGELFIGEKSARVTVEFKADNASISIAAVDGHGHLRSSFSGNNCDINIDWVQGWNFDGDVINVYIAIMKG